MIERIYIWAMLHIQRLPYFISILLDRRFDIQPFILKTDDPLPRRLLFRRIYRPTINTKTGEYRYGVMPLKVGQRFKALQMIQRNNVPAAFRLFYRVPGIYMYIGAFGKINRLTVHMMRDLEAREKRDRGLQSPLTDLQKKAGYDRMNHGLFGVIDYMATRNGLTYHEVEQLSDATLYAVMKIDHDREKVRRKEIELQAAEQNRKLKQRRRI